MRRDICQTRNPRAFEGLIAQQTPLLFTDVLSLLFLNSLILLHTAPILPNGYYFKCHTRRWGAFQHINKNPVRLESTSADQQMFISLGRVAYSCTGVTPDFSSWIFMHQSAIQGVLERTGRKLGTEIADEICSLSSLTQKNNSWYREGRYGGRHTAADRIGYAFTHTWSNDALRGLLPSSQLFRLERGYVWL
jgi:hypothetical protein